MGMVFSMASTAKDSLTEIILFNKEKREREEEERAQRELEVSYYPVVLVYICDVGALSVLSLQLSFV